MLRKIYYLLGPGLRRNARRIVFLPSDIKDSILGRRQGLVPPKGMIFTGRSDFVTVGNEFLEKFVAMGKLEPHHKVLDIGCGIGRLARPMADFLDQNGSYDGFDIVADGVNWCKKAYRNYPNFNFRHLPLKNDLYNLTASSKADTLSFPYDDNSFDFAFLISVFTHMQQDAVNQYIKEIARVLKPGRRCISTFFVITPNSDKFLDNSPDPFFKYKYPDYYLHDHRVKDANIAFKYNVIEDMLNQAGLELVSFHPGWWAGLTKNDSSSFQDIIVIEKRI